MPKSFFSAAGRRRWVRWDRRAMVPPSANGGSNGNGHGSGHGGGSDSRDGSQPPPTSGRGSTDPCPSAETYAELLDGRLRSPQREQVRAHIRQCPTCREGVVEVVATLFALADEDTITDESARRLDQAVAAIEMMLARDLDEAQQKLAQLEDQDKRQSKRLQPERPRLRQQDQQQQKQQLQPPATLPTTLRGRRASNAAVAASAALLLIATASFLFISSRPRHAGSLSTSSMYGRLFTTRFAGRSQWTPVMDDIGRARRFLASYAFQPVDVRGVGEARTPTELGALGVRQTLAGQLDSGVELLARATAADQHSAELLSDSAAVLLARIEIVDRKRAEGGATPADEGRDGDVLAALELLDRALEISPDLEAALFNRALALGQLRLRRSARVAWQRYLEVDARSPWATEAQQRLEAIEVPARFDPIVARNELAAAAAAGDHDRLLALVAEHRHLARRTVQEDLLPAWGATWLARDTEQAERQLRTASNLAEEWEAQTADRTLLAAVDEVERASDAQRGRLAAGYRELGVASRAFDALEIERADAAAQRALQSLPVTSPAFVWARLLRLVCTYYRDGALGRDALEVAHLGANDLASIGRAYWILGIWNARRGRLSNAVDALGKSLDSYERLDESEPITWLHCLLAETYGFMGMRGPSWRHGRLALDHPHSLSGGQSELALLVELALMSLLEERPRAANDLLAEGLLEPDPNHPEDIANAHVRRTYVLHSLGRSEQARRELEKAATWFLRTAPFMRRQLGADLHLLSGLLDDNSERAVRRISQALTQFREVGPQFRLPSVLLARAQANQRAGDPKAADADLRQGLALLEAQPDNGLADVWTRRLEGPDRLFDESVVLALRQGRPEEAFAIAEAGRARSLAMLAAHGNVPSPAGNLRVGEIRRQLGPDETLLFFSWLDDRVVLWQLGRPSLRFVTVNTAPAALGQLVKTLAADLKAGVFVDATRDASIRLYKALLGSVQIGSGALAIVPDGMLHDLPFGALVDPRTGQFLVEQHEISLAPSAAAFLQSRSRRQSQLGAPADALVIGDPLVDSVRFPGIRPLAGAREEARQVARLYGRRELLLGGAATRSAFLAAIGRRAVVHFSGHAVANRVDPGRSSLPLATDPDGSEGLLVASDIARLDLTGTRAVVLSGCETGVGEDGGNEGSLSLARAFLVAGAPNVVASLWPIADAPSTPLMAAFHRRLRAGDPPANALRAAQLEMLRSKDLVLTSPSTWAAFEAFGG